MSPNLKGALRWALGLLLSAVGIALVVMDAVVTAQGKMALHTINAVVALILVFLGGFVIDPAWAGNLLTSVSTSAGDFEHAKAGECDHHE